MTARDKGLTGREIAKALRAAKDVVSRGWCRGKFGFGGSEHCAAGAMMEDRSTYGNELLAAFCAAISSKDLKLRKDSRVEVIVGWNDQLERTQQEVIDAFERAAKMAEIDQKLSALKEEEYELTCK